MASEAKIKLEYFTSKFNELNDMCMQQQYMIQVLEIENLVAMSQLDAKPMDIVQEALVDSI